MSDVSRSVEVIFKRIREAAARAGRKPDEIVLVAATKGVPLEKIQEGAECGVTAFGENKVQEAERKFFETSFLEGRRPPVSLHLIGPLQTNKVKKAVGRFDLIHSIDSLRLAERIEEEAAGRFLTQPVLVQVNIGGEPSKHGAPVAQAPSLVEAIRGLPHLALQGLMTLPPPTPDPEGARPYFSALREMGRALGLSRFSMGMSSDFEIAIEEGATWVRIGTAIFGAR
ncbi:MAG TPA: YggS family pyridoxal phosphate-dependent enzyme [Candidatus Manganitrophaceae bacterium]|nr:YggS family pyridoxal phosphate-dependent enzyme [Candidatus Manganitrophaceae bacterium]